MFGNFDHLSLFLCLIYCLPFVLRVVFIFDIHDLLKVLGR